MPDLRQQCGSRDALFNRLLCAVLLVSLLSAVVSFVLVSRRNPNGDFDAVSVWNLRARFLARGSDNWRGAFAQSPSLPHPNYPLLLPGTVARSWKYIGCESPLVPMAIAFMFTFSTVGTLWSALASLRNKEAGYLGGIVLLGVPSFVALGASQYADVETGFFMLSAIIMCALYDAGSANGNIGFLVLAGAAAGFCSWTKNEGLLFLGVLLAVRMVLSARKGLAVCTREAMALMLGLLPIVAAVAYFKIKVAPTAYYLTVGKYSTTGPMRYFLDPGTTSQKLTDVSRYGLIARAMASEILHLGGRTVGVVPLLLLYILLMGVRKRSIIGVETGILVSMLMLAGYFAVYLTTPLELEFHLRTSLSRLVLQLWPSVVFVALMAASVGKTREVRVN